MIAFYLSFVLAQPSVSRAVDYDPLRVDKSQVVKTVDLRLTKLTYRHAGRDFRLTDVHGTVIRDIVA